MDATCNQALKFRKPLLMRLFPRRGLPPLEDRDGFAPGALGTTIFVKFDLVDRLRILFSGKVEILTRTYTDVAVEKAWSESVTSVLPPNSDWI